MNFKFIRKKTRKGSSLECRGHWITCSYTRACTHTLASDITCATTRQDVQYRGQDDAKKSQSTTTPLHSLPMSALPARDSTTHDHSTHSPHQSFQPTLPGKRGSSSANGRESLQVTTLSLSLPVAQTVHSPHQLVCHSSTQRAGGAVVELS